MKPYHILLFCVTYTYKKLEYSQNIRSFNVLVMNEIGFGISRNSERKLDITLFTQKYIVRYFRHFVDDNIVQYHNKDMATCII